MSSLTPQDKKVVQMVRALHAYDHERVPLLLAYAGVKPVSLFIPGHYRWLKPEPLRTREKDTRDVIALCKAAGLTYHKHVDKRSGWKGVVHFDIARDARDLQKLAKLRSLKTESARERGLGTLLGYPATAVAEFAKGQGGLLPINDDLTQLPASVLKQDYIAFLALRLSKKNWRKELQVIKLWAETIRKLDPALYKRIVGDHRRALKKYFKGK